MNARLIQKKMLIWLPKGNIFSNLDQLNQMFVNIMITNYNL